MRLMMRALSAWLVLGEGEYGAFGTESERSVGVEEVRFGGVQSIIEQLEEVINYSCSRTYLWRSSFANASRQECS